MSSIEVFKAIPSCPGYEVSQLGNIISKKRCNVANIRTFANGRGFQQAAFFVDGKLKMVYVARLVLEAFRGFPTDSWLCVARHINGDMSDCRLENLEWDVCETTSEYDPSKSHRKGVLKPSGTKEKMTVAKLNQSEDTLRRAAETRRKTRCLKKMMSS